MNESLSEFKEWLLQQEAELREQPGKDRDRERVAAALNLIDEFLRS